MRDCDDIIRLLEEEAQKIAQEVYVIGDAEKACTANHATETGLAVGFKL